jgi:hypothetical protein
MRLHFWPLLLRPALSRQAEARADALGQHEQVKS